jgi:hypothetical protein
MASQRYSCDRHCQLRHDAACSLVTDGCPERKYFNDELLDWRHGC